MDTDRYMLSATTPLVSHHLRLAAWNTSTQLQCEMLEWKLTIGETRLLEPSWKHHPQTTNTFWQLGTYWTCCEPVASYTAETKQDGRTFHSR